MNQAYISTPQGHISDCKLDSVVHAGVCGCMCGKLIWACHVWAKSFMPNSFRVPGHCLNSDTGEEK